MFYENYLNSIKPDTSYIPESASLNDKAIFAERAYQDAFNEAFFALASQEMAVFEAAIHEADGEAANVNPESKKKLLDVVKNAITTIWTKVKGFFLDTIQTIQKKFNDFKKAQGDKIKNDFKKGVAALPADYKAKGIYKFDWIKNPAIKDKTDAVANLANKAYGEIGIDGFADKYNKNTIAQALGFDSAENFEIKAPEKVEVSVADIKSAQGLILDTVFDPNSFLKSIKVAYKNAKKSIDGAMKSARDAINKKDKSFAEHNKACKEAISFCKDCSSIITKYVSKRLTVLKAVRGNYAALLAKIAIKGSGKVKDTKAVGEDTEITINVPDDKADVEVNEPAPEATPEVKDEVEEAFAALMEEDEADDVEFDATEAESEGKGCKSCKEDVNIDIEVDEDDDDVEATDAEIEESTLYRALVAYLG